MKFVYIIVSKSMQSTEITKLPLAVLKKNEAEESGGMANRSVVSFYLRTNSKIKDREFSFQCQESRMYLFSVAIIDC